jgi:hypothetical protein
MIIKNFLKNMLSSSTGEISSKRVIGFAGFVVLSATMIVTAIAKRQLTPDPVLVDAVSYITIAALFGNTVEKFTSFNKSKSEE